MRWMALASLAVALAGCGQRGSENQASATEKVTEPKLGGTEAPDASNQTAAAANAAMRFIGTWASSKAECASKPWIFTAKALTVAGGPHCSFYQVSQAPEGYNLAATCPTKQPVHTDLIKLRFAGSAQGMLVESNAIPPTGLVGCGK
jgi:predicted small lipoprotein YifL